MSEHILGMVNSWRGRCARAFGSLLLMTIAVVDGDGLLTVGDTGAECVIDMVLWYLMPPSDVGR